MVTISKALSSGQAQSYHKLEFTSETQSYYKQDGAVEGQWQGKLAEKFGLSGPVTAEAFTLLTEGKHPETEQQMVKHRAAQEYTNADGTVTKAVEHRAAWDATFSAPKSVSLTALVGGDERVREAHAAAVTTALNELERYTQARIGGNNSAETTGKFIAAKFEHDTARPVEGYAAPQLHTHAVIFNVTERPDGGTRALQERALFDSQSFATAVYQSALTYELRNRGYEIETGRSGAPEIKGYSREYLDASSPRSQQIKEHLEKFGRNSPEAAQIAAHATRDGKQLLTPEEVLSAHRQMAAEFGDQPQRVVAEARERARSQERKPDDQSKAQEAVAYAKSSIYEREAVSDERVILRDALRRGMGETTYAAVKAEFDARQGRGEFRQVEGQKHDTGRGFTTPETIANERANVAHVMRGLSQVQPIMTKDEAAAQAETRAFLNEAQRTVITEVLTTTDRIHGLQGLAGTGKTTVLESIREGAEREGYTVEGFAPSSRAAGQLRDAGIRATTLQSFVARGGDPAENASPHLYMLDESSLASTKQMRAFLDKIGPDDRVLVIGDTRQHQGVEAGRPFQQMQEAGMQTSQLSEIVRQKDPELLKAVELLAKGETAAGVKLLADQGRITEIANGPNRIMAIAKDYAAKPENTLIISPDNRSRVAINQAVRTELRANGTLSPESREFSTLTHRSDMTGADRMWAARYSPDDVLQYTTGSKALGIERDSYATVRSVDAKTNTLTVERGDGELVSYDPKRLKGVNVYREVQREIAIGERVQFTAPHKGLGVANRDLGTVTKIEPHQITVKMDGDDERVITFDPTKMRHFEHGYAVTSHSAQGLTAGRIIANMDGETARSLINTRLAYVAISRAAEDARIYTNDAATIGQRLATEFSKTAAVDFTERPRLAKERQTALPEPPRKEQSIREYADVNHRIAAVALDYAARPENTVIVAPDRAERIELTQLIRADLKAQGLITESRAVPVLIERQLARPKLAADYTPGDIILYKAGNKAKEVPANSAGIVIEADPKKNLLTVQTADGREIVYNPALTPSMTKLSTVHRQERRDLGTGDRIEITMPDKEQGIRNRDLGTVTQIASDHALTVRLDNGKTVKIDADKANHIEHGYTVEGTKNFHAQRVLVSIGGPAEVAAESALARAISRSSASTTFYTSDGPSLSENQAAERARIVNTGHLVIDQAIHSVPTTAEIGKLFSLADIERHLAPIREALEPEDAAQFKWKGETGTIQTYQHTETGRNIHIDGKTGHFYAQDGRLTDQDAALDRAMPAGRAHSQQNELENIMGLGR